MTYRRLLTNAVAQAALNDGVVPADILAEADALGVVTSTLERDVERVLAQSQS
jgi:hypothetical protein